MRHSGGVVVEGSSSEHDLLEDDTEAVHVPLEGGCGARVDATCHQLWCRPQ